MSLYIFRVVKNASPTNNDGFSNSTLNWFVNPQGYVFSNEYWIEAPDDNIATLEHIASVLVEAESKLLLACSFLFVSAFSLAKDASAPDWLPPKMFFPRLIREEHFDGNYAPLYTRLDGEYSHILTHTRDGGGTARVNVRDARAANPYHRAAPFDVWYSLDVTRSRSQGPPWRATYLNVLDETDFYFEADGTMKLRSNGRLASCRFPAYVAAMEEIKPLMSLWHGSASTGPQQGPTLVGEFFLRCASDRSAMRKNYYRNISAKENFSRIICETIPKIAYAMRDVNSSSRMFKTMKNLPFAYPRFIEVLEHAYAGNGLLGGPDTLMVGLWDFYNDIADARGFGPNPLYQQFPILGIRPQPGVVTKVADDFGFTDTLLLLVLNLLTYYQTNPLRGFYTASGFPGVSIPYGNIGYSYYGAAIGGRNKKADAEYARETQGAADWLQAHGTEFFNYTLLASSLVGAFERNCSWENAGDALALANRNRKKGVHTISTRNPYPDKWAIPHIDTQALPRLAYIVQTYDEIPDAEYQRLTAREKMPCPVEPAEWKPLLQQWIIDQTPWNQSERAPAPAVDPIPPKKVFHPLPVQPQRHNVPGWIGGSAIVSVPGAAKKLDCDAEQRKADTAEKLLGYGWDGLKLFLQATGEYPTDPVSSYALDEAIKKYIHLRCQNLNRCKDPLGGIEDVAFGLLGGALIRKAKEIIEKLGIG